jgi:hypothetical protein
MFQSEAEETERANGSSPSDQEINVARRHSENDRLLTGDRARYNTIDSEVARYAAAEAIEISTEENVRLRKLIDKRVLTIMIATYFLQAIDKGTLSFGTIMGLPADIGQANPDGTPGPNWPWLTTCVYLGILVVEYPQVSQSNLPKSWFENPCLTTDCRTTLYLGYQLQSI